MGKHGNHRHVEPQAEGLGIDWELVVMIGAIPLATALLVGFILLCKANGWA